MIDELREVEDEIFEGFSDDNGGFKNTRGIFIPEKLPRM